MHCCHDEKNSYPANKEPQENPQKTSYNRTIFKTDTIGSDTLDKVTLRAQATVLACEEIF